MRQDWNFLELVVPDVSNVQLTLHLRKRKSITCSQTWWRQCDDLDFSTGSALDDMPRLIEQWILLATCKVPAIHFSVFYIFRYIYLLMFQVKLFPPFFLFSQFLSLLLYLSLVSFNLREKKIPFCYLFLLQEIFEAQETGTEIPHDKGLEEGQLCCIVWMHKRHMPLICFTSMPLCTGLDIIVCHYVTVSMLSVH